MIFLHIFPLDNIQPHIIYNLRFCVYALYELKKCLYLIIFILQSYKNYMLINEC